MIFASIANLSTDTVKEWWNPQILESKDLEVSNANQTLKDEIINGAKMIIEHYSSKAFADGVEYTVVEKNDGKDVGEYSVVNGKLRLRASSPVCFARTFYSWVKQNHYGMADFIEHNIEIPATLEDQAPSIVTSHFKHHYILNTATFGYTTAYWGENEWNNFLFWAAVHGYDMPLALKGSNPILERTFKSFGATDGDLSNFFNGPAYETWQRQGELMGWDTNPYRSSFNIKDIQLQHKILDRMNIFKMKPIVPCFAGFIPKALADKNNIPVEQETWGSFPDNKSYLINPTTKSGFNWFKNITKKYVEEYEKEYGAQQLYLADTFEEMKIPGNESQKVNFINKTSQSLYEGIQETAKSNNHESTFVVQGWDFGYQPHIWNQERFDAYALLNLENNEKGSIYEKNFINNHQMFIDLAEDYSRGPWNNASPYNKFNAFRGRSWIYSTASNMGGKVQKTGNLEFYKQGGFEALGSYNRGNLQGYGTGAEGLENNQVVMELIADAGWVQQEMSYNSLTSWITNYSINRYMAKPFDLTDYLTSRVKFWGYWADIRRHEPGNLGAYTELVSHPWSEFQLFCKWGELRDHWEYRDNQSPNTLSAYKSFIEKSRSQIHKKRSKFLEKDLYENEVHLITNKIDSLLRTLYTSGKSMPKAQLETLSNRLLHYFDVADEILANHPLWTMRRYLEQARAWGDTPAEKNYYEQDAKRILTAWGIDRDIHEYAGRVWGGFLKQWYKPQIKAFLDHLKDPVAHPTWKWGYVHDSNSPHYDANWQSKYLVNENDWLKTPIDFNQLSRPNTTNAFERSFELMDSLDS